jgi:ankyrin repeat protein
MEAKADLNAQNRGGNTALTCSLYNNDVKMMELLLVQHSLNPH